MSNEFSREACELRKAQVNEKLERHEKQLEELITWKQDIDIFNIKNSVELKALIVSAVEEGQKQTIIQLEKIDKRVEILENKDAEVALKEKKEKEKETKVSKKFIANTILACFITTIITFFITLLLNNAMTIKSFEERYTEQTNYMEEGK